MHNVQIIKEELLDIAISEEFISGEENNNICMSKWYRHQIAKNWSLARVDDDFFLPIAIKHLIGIEKIYMPPYIQRIESYGSKEKTKFEHALERIFATFKSGILSLSKPLDNFPAGIKVQQRDNYILDLNESYANIRARYEHGHKNRINQFHHQGYYIKETKDVKMFLDFYLKNLPKGIPKKYNSKQFLSQYLDTLNGRHASIMLMAFSPQHEALGCILFLKSGKKIINILSANSMPGRKHSAIHACIDNVIHQHAASDIILDFEGSMIPNVAKFFAAFGALKENYYCYSWNRSWRLSVINTLFNYFRP